MLEDLKAHWPDWHFDLETPPPGFRITGWKRSDPDQVIDTDWLDDEDLAVTLACLLLLP